MLHVNFSIFLNIKLNFIHSSLIYSVLCNCILFLVSVMHYNNYFSRKTISKVYFLLASKLSVIIFFPDIDIFRAAKTKWLNYWQ